MDAIKNAMKGASSDSNKQQQQQQPQSSQGAQGSQQDDYVDKGTLHNADMVTRQRWLRGRSNLLRTFFSAFGAAAQKSGYNIDRDTQEKITDTGRGMFEKGTG